MTTNHPVARAIDDLGGPAAIADKLHKKPAAIRMWKVRKRIPRTVWPELCAEFPSMTQDRLKEIEAA